MRCVAESALFEPASRSDFTSPGASALPGVTRFTGVDDGSAGEAPKRCTSSGRSRPRVRVPYYNVSLEVIARHKKTLEDKATTKSDFVASLRQLSSMLLTKDLLEQSMIGLCVNRVAKKHPDGDMRVLARNIVEKWREEVRGQVKRDAKRS